MVGIVDFGSTKTPAIAHVLTKLGYKSNVIPWKECDSAKFEQFNSAILSGAPVLFTEVDHRPYSNAFNFLKTSTIPVMGICFGHQLLGLIYGATVFKSQAIRALTAIEIVKEDALFKGMPPTFNMMADHTEGITLPANFTGLARSLEYMVEAMKHTIKPVYGVQFHPEVSAGVGEMLIHNFLRIQAKASTRQA